MGCRVERWVRLVSPEEKAYKKWLILPVFSVCIGVVRDSKIIFVFLLLLLMSCTCFLHGVVDPVLIGEPDHHSDKGNLNLIHVLCIF